MNLSTSMMERLSATWSPWNQTELSVLVSEGNTPQSCKLAVVRATVQDHLCPNWTGETTRYMCMHVLYMLVGICLYSTPCAYFHAPKKWSGSLHFNWKIHFSFCCISHWLTSDCEGEYYCVFFCHSNIPPGAWPWFFFVSSWPNSQSLLHIIPVLFARICGFLCVNLLCVCTVYWCPNACVKF